MVITEETRLNKALDLHPAVVEYIISLNPHDFARLRKPLMRRLMAPRITLGRVAAMVGVPVGQVLERVAAFGGVTASYGERGRTLPQSAKERPCWVAKSDPTAVPVVNLLPIDETLDADPMPPVLDVIKQLAPGDVFFFRHKWEPQPFYDVWTKMGGLEWFAERRGPDEWWIWVRRVPHEDLP